MTLKVRVVAMTVMALLSAVAFPGVGVHARQHAASAAPFLVNATADAVDKDPGDGLCAATGGKCTLRAAIQETNALAGADTISLPAGTYLLTIAGSGEDAGASGDLDITDHLTIISRS